MGGQGSGRKPNIAELYNSPQSSVQFSEGQKSKGIVDDFAERQNIDTKEGTIQKTPVNEKDIVNKEYVDSIAGRASLDLFLTENASDIGTYFDLEVDIVTAAKENIVQSITAGGTTLIASFASILNEEEINALEILESGIYNYHAHAEGQSANNLFIYFEFYHRTAGGTETLLGTSHDSGELTTSEADYDLHSSITDEKAFVSGDRIVCKVYGRNNSAAARNVTIYMEGNTASRAEFPGFISLGNFLLKNGSNADTTVNIGSQNFTTTGSVHGTSLILGTTTLTEQNLIDLLALI